MTLLTQAITLAALAHDGQTDKAGLPYILHPLRVMMRMETDDERIVAVLHDVLEDSPVWDFDKLAQEYGFLVISAVDILTRRKGQRYERYIEGIARDPLATRVKLADLADNLDPSRPFTSKLPAAMVARYERAREVLLATTKDSA